MTQWNRWGNESVIERLENELPHSTIYWLLISIFASIAWITYLTYYNSRVFGLIFTIISNKFIKGAYVKFGKFYYQKKIIGLLLLGQFDLH